MLKDKSSAATSLSVNKLYLFEDMTGGKGGVLTLRLEDILPLQLSKTWQYIFLRRERDSKVMALATSNII